MGNKMKVYIYTLGKDLSVQTNKVKYIDDEMGLLCFGDKKRRLICTHSMYGFDNLLYPYSSNLQVYKKLTDNQVNKFKCFLEREKKRIERDGMKTINEII